MKNITKLCLLAAAALPTSAYAADGTGFYGSLNVGGASVSDVNVTEFAPAGQIFPVVSAPIEEAAIPAGSDTVEGSYKLKSAFQISGSLGYDFGMVRTEVEVSYARNKIKSVTINKANGIALPAGALEADSADVCTYLELSSCSVTGNTVNFGGQGPKLRQLNAMANVWVDVPLGLPVEPYVGGGLGIAGFEIDGEGKGRFAWQIGGGVAFPLGSNVALTADLRYREANGSTVNDAGYGFDIDKIKTFSYGVGIRFSF